VHEPKETGAFTINANKIELFMAANDIQKIKDPDPWIADTVAFAHSTRYDNNMIEHRPDNTTIAMGSAL
jgi:hypothetical protein